MHHWNGKPVADTTLIQPTLDVAPPVLRF